MCVTSALRYTLPYSLTHSLTHSPTYSLAYLLTQVDVDNCLLYIFQELVPGGSIAQLLKKFGPFEPSIVKQYTRQILFGLEFLHSEGIIHRDIKGGNVLVDINTGVAKLADFGASTTLQLGETQETLSIKGTSSLTHLLTHSYSLTHLLTHSLLLTHSPTYSLTHLLTHSLGTPFFMAPEVLAHTRYGRKGDIWAVGCTMIQMLTGEPPWKDRNIKTLIQLHVLLSTWTESTPPISCKNELSSECRECLEMCFKKVRTLLTHSPFSLTRSLTHSTYLLTHSLTLLTHSLTLLTHSLIHSSQ